MIWNVNPIALSFGVFEIYWYGILFFLAIISATVTMQIIYRIEKLPSEHIYDQLLNMLIAIFIGARLVECIFYHPHYYFNNPYKIFAIWEGGLSSHGGALGSIIVVYLYSKKYKINFYWIFDRLVISIAIFAFFIRIANFMNSEIIGIPSSLPWAIKFQNIDLISRHPVQLYEAFIFLIIFLMLIIIYKKFKKIPKGSLLGIFLTITFISRFLIEFLKERQASYNSEFFLSLGQILSLPFIGIGVYLLTKIFIIKNISFKKKVKLQI